MFTSHPQYLFILSSYTNILNIHAFTNWHDVSWGSKTGKVDLEVGRLPPLIAVGREEDSRFIDVAEGVGGPAPLQEDVDKGFEAVALRVRAPYSAKPSIPAKSVKSTEETFRTRLVAVYIFSNSFLCVLVMNESFDQSRFLVPTPSYDFLLLLRRIVDYTHTRPFIFAFRGTNIALNTAPGNSYQHKIWFFRIWMWAISGLFLLRVLGSCYHLLHSFRLSFRGRCPWKELFRP